jgi:rod shape determining protein RodA
LNATLGATVKGFQDEVTRERARSAYLRLDPLLLLATVGLIVFGVYTIGTATRGDIPGNPHYYLVRQAMYAGVGVVLMLVLARVDYSRFREWRIGIYAATVGLIVVTFGLAGVTRGSKRWIALPFFNLQPSEMGKVLLVLALAGFMIDRARRISEKETTALILLLAIFPAMLVVAQPDLGSGLVYLAIAGAVLFVAGTKWTHFVVLSVLAVGSVCLVLIAAPAAGMHVLKQYQVDRLTAFMHPTDNPRQQGYQLKQSMVGIGAGEKTGRGPRQATQTKLNFIPEHHTDFIFSVVGEEFGFMGAAIVLSLYALLIWRALRILTMAKNLYGALVAGGIAAMLMFQVFVNVGMTIGIMPITGVPLPLMSYGGSSVITTLVALGVLQSVHVQARTQSAVKRTELLV